MSRFKLKYLASGEIVGYESQPLAMIDLLAAYPSGVAKNPHGELVTPQTKDWPVRDGLIFTFWRYAGEVDNPQGIFAQFIAL